jgi:hypothetical protein
MKTLFTLVFGMGLGFVLAVGAMRYHLVRAADGMHLVPKRTANLKEAYVDIREFDAVAWTEHEDLAFALVEADKAHLIADSAKNDVRNAVEGVLNSLK